METKKVTAQWASRNPGRNYWFQGADDLVLLSGLDALVDGSRIILEFGSHGEFKVKPDFEIVAEVTDEDLLALADEKHAAQMMS
jgi:hypothetical protein